MSDTNILSYDHYTKRSSVFDLDNHFAGDRWLIDDESGEQTFTVADLLPHGVAWLLAGDGAAGKSFLMQTLCTILAVPDGRVPFLGRQVRPCKTVYISAEDSGDVLERRHFRICQAYGIDPRELVDRLALCSLTEMNDVWLFRDGEITDHFKELGAELCDFDVGFCGLDSASAFFADNENDRVAVGKFMRALNRMSKSAELGIGLIAHTSRTSRADAAHMASGSTGWTFGGRAGLLLEVDEPDEEGSDLTLGLLKPNHSRRGIKIAITPDQHGVPMLKDTSSKVASIEKDKDDRFACRSVEECWTGDAAPLTLIGDRSLVHYLVDHVGWTKKRAMLCKGRLLHNKLIAPDRRSGELRGLRLTQKGKTFLNGQATPKTDDLSSGDAERRRIFDEIDKAWHDRNPFTKTHAGRYLPDHMASLTPPMAVRRAEKLLAEMIAEGEVVLQVVGKRRGYGLTQRGQKARKT
jgi:AAA domain-containing protein